MDLLLPHSDIWKNYILKLEYIFKFAENTQRIIFIN